MGADKMGADKDTVAGSDINSEAVKVDLDEINAQLAEYRQRESAKSEKSEKNLADGTNVNKEERFVFDFGERVKDNERISDDERINEYVRVTEKKKINKSNKSRTGSKIFVMQAVASAVFIFSIVMLKSFDKMPEAMEVGINATVNENTGLEVLNTQLWSVIDDSDLLSAVFNAGIENEDENSDSGKEDGVTEIEDETESENSDKDDNDGNMTKDSSTNINAANMEAQGGPTQNETTDKITDEALTKNIKIELDFITPLFGQVTSGFGERTDPINGKKGKHNGMDIAAPTGWNIKAAFGGVVHEAGYSNEYGRYTVIDHGDGIMTLYGHCQRLSVTVGENVIKGGVIATVGSSGKSTGSHLHFEIIKDGIRLNPSDYIELA